MGLELGDGMNETIDARRYEQKINFMGMESKIIVEKILDKNPKEVLITIVTPLITQAKTFPLDDAIKTLQQVNEWLRNENV